MPSLLSPRRLPELRLPATESREATVRSDGADETEPVLGWLLLAMGGAVATALIGWIVVAGLTVVGWLAGDAGTLGGALRLGTQLWLLGHGAGARLGGPSMTLTPLGLSLLVAFLLSRFASLAGRRSRSAPGRTVLRVATVMTLAYVAPVVSTALLTGSPAQAARGLVGSLLLGAVGSVWGSLGATGQSFTAGWPRWCRAVPRGVGAALAVLLAGGAAIVVLALVAHFDRVRTLTDALGAGVVGGIALLAVQLAFLPNLVVWASGYGLGAGFSLGAGGTVAPNGTDLGLLPGVPVLGALPAEGPGPAWWAAWLGIAVLAGVAAAAVVVQARPGARFDETSLVGGATGALAGLVFTGVSWLSGGSLGTHRLVGLGPQLLPTLVVSVTTMGIAAMLAGLLLGLLRPSR